MLQDFFFFPHMSRTRNIIAPFSTSKQKQSFDECEKETFVSALHTLRELWSIVFWNVRFFHFCYTAPSSSSTRRRPFQACLYSSLLLSLPPFFPPLLSSPRVFTIFVWEFSRWLIDFQMDETKLQNIFIVEKLFFFFCAMENERAQLMCVHINGHPPNGLMISNSLLGQVTGAAPSEPEMSSLARAVRVKRVKSTKSNRKTRTCSMVVICYFTQQWRLVVSFFSTLDQVDSIRWMGKKKTQFCACRSLNR